jgi:trehalose 6-phosphate synthase
VGNVLIEPVPRARAGTTSSASTSQESQLIVLAHRGPLRFATAGSERVVERNGGGLVTALRDVMRHVDEPRFICAASTPDDRAAASVGWQRVSVGEETCVLRMLDLDETAHHDFYAVVANPLLWFIHHSLWKPDSPPAFGPREFDAWNHGYAAINRAFAAALTSPDDVPEGSVVMVHDYHFYLVPELVRRERPDLFVHFFVHVPWPSTEQWRALPPQILGQLLVGVLGSDIIGFQTPRDVTNFLKCCQDVLGLEVDIRRSSVRLGGRVVAVRSYPISVDETALREVAVTEQVARHQRELEAQRREKLLVRVDRTDPAKNAVRGFHAFDRLLELHPELRGRITFLALLQPSRQDVAEYSDYLREIHDVVADVNRRHGRPGWTPIDLRLGDDMDLVLAAYKCFDVFVVNSVRDGMNLVCKEALLLNERDGVLALSVEAGAHHELHDVAVPLRPFDVDQQANALYQALNMTQDERRARHEIGADIVRTNDVHRWLEHQLLDIALMSGERRTLARR